MGNLWLDVIHKEF